MSEDFDEQGSGSEDDPGFIGGGGPPSTIGDDDPLADEHGDRLAGDLDEFDEEEI